MKYLKIFFTTLRGMATLLSSLCCLSRFSVVKSVVLEGEEEILDIFAGLDEKQIFLELKNFFVCNIQDFLHLDRVLRRRSTSLSELGQSLLLSSEHSLDVEPLLVELSGIVLTDSFSNVIILCSGVGGIEVFSEVLLEINKIGLANRFGLLDQVVLNILSAVQIVLVGFFVHCHLVISLVVNSFSHELVLLHSDHFLDVLLDQLKQVDVGLLLNILVIGVDLSLKFIFDVEEFTDVFLTDLLQPLVHGTFHFFVVTNLVGVWENTGAHLLGERGESTSWTN